MSVRTSVLNKAFILTLHDNTSHISALKYHSRPKQRQQVVHLSIGPKQRHQVVHFSIGAPPRDWQQIDHLRGITSRPKQRQQIVRFLALAHHFDTKEKATHRLSWHRGTTASTRQKKRQQIAHLSLGHHFQTKATATKRTSGIMRRQRRTF